MSFDCRHGPGDLVFLAGHMVFGGVVQSAARDLGRWMVSVDHCGGADLCAGRNVVFSAGCGQNAGRGPNSFLGNLLSDGNCDDPVFAEHEMRYFLVDVCCTLLHSVWCCAGMYGMEPAMAGKWMQAIYVRHAVGNGVSGRSRISGSCLGGGLVLFRSVFCFSASEAAGEFCLGFAVGSKWHERLESV